MFPFSAPLLTCAPSQLCTFSPTPVPLYIFVDTFVPPPPTKHLDQYQEALYAPIHSKIFDCYLCCTPSHTHLVNNISVPHTVSSTHLSFSFSFNSVPPPDTPRSPCPLTTGVLCRGGCGFEPQVGFLCKAPSSHLVCAFRFILHSFRLIQFLQLSLNPFRFNDIHELSSSNFIQLHSAR